MTQPTTLEIANTLRAIRFCLPALARASASSEAKRLLKSATDLIERYGPLKGNTTMSDWLASSLSEIVENLEREAQDAAAGRVSPAARTADQLLAAFDRSSEHKLDFVSVMRRMYDVLLVNANVVTENTDAFTVDAVLKDASTLLGQVDAGSALQPDLAAELRALPRMYGGGGVDAAAMESVLVRFEADRARGLAALESTDRDECVIRLANGRAIHVPSAPAACDYVRVVERGEEIAYWNSDEWQEAPAEVMGALMGAAKGGALEGAPETSESDSEAGNSVRIEVDSAERATVLAALHVYREQGFGDPDTRPDDVHDIATDNDSVISLDDDGIEALVSRIKSAA